MSTHIGFVGAGRIATAIAHGLINQGFSAPSNICAFDVDASTLHACCDPVGAKPLSSVAEVAAFASVIVIAVKPHVVSSALTDLAPHIKPHHLIVSVAAGIRLDAMSAVLPNASRIMRVMPNTPCLVSSSATVISPGPLCTKDDEALVVGLFRSVGIAFVLPEASLDAVTALSGSGPAYVYTFIEALADAGVTFGLPRDVALQLAAQTVVGAGRMVLETATHPAALRDAVMSPGGTTAAGMWQLEKGGLRAAVVDAVGAAFEKSKALSGARM